MNIKPFCIRVYIPCEGSTLIEAEQIWRSLITQGMVAELFNIEDEDSCTA